VRKKDIKNALTDAANIIDVIRNPNAQQIIRKL
jgi:hypothetical protein